MSAEVESNDQENRRLVFGLLELINKLDLSEDIPHIGDRDESLIADLEDAIGHMSDMGEDRGIEILVSMLARGKYDVTYKGETK
jgi:hypothetical protein